MSDFPGYPSPFSTWNLSSPARPVFPIGGVPVPGLVSGISSFLEPGYYPAGVGPASLPDPLTAFLSSPYRTPPPVSSRFLPGLTDLPALGVEPLYGCGIREPRGIAHSPNFLFSQNPSPLTFDQIYRSGSNSVSPVSQYRNQFDQRYVNSRLLVPGRLSEPLVRKGSSLLNVKGKEDKQLPFKDNHNKNSSQSEENSSTSKHVTQERSKKIWNPFEAETTHSTSTVGRQTNCQTILESKPSSIQCKDSILIKSTANVSENEDNEKSVVDKIDNVKQLPRQPIPQYPVKPIPLYENQRLALNSSVSSLDHTSIITPESTHHSYSFTADLDTPLKPQNSQVDYFGNISKVSLSVDVSTSNSKVASSLKGSNEIEKGEKIVRDLNQNLHVERNNNHSKIGAADCSINDKVPKDSSISGDIAITDKAQLDKLNNTEVIIVSDTEEVYSNISENSERIKTDENRNIEALGYPQFQDQRNEAVPLTAPEFSAYQNSYSQLKLQIENEHTSSYVPYVSSIEDKCVESSQPSVDDSHFKSSVQGTKLTQVCCESSKEVPLKNACLTSPKGSVKECETSSLNQHSPSKTSKSKTLLSPKRNRDSLKTKELKDELSVLSHQVNEIRNRRNSLNKDTISLSSEHIIRDNSELDKKPIEVGKVNPRRGYRSTMASSPAALTVMKNSEDSLSASISSSQISESDSDTQLSIDNAEKLFPESQTENTHGLYSDSHVNDQSTYLAPGPGNRNCDNQFYKTNNPQMCQSEPDNQKPYLCVQEQNRFNEKSQILPPYNCYTPNQSTNVLPPDEDSFHVHHEGDLGNFQRSNLDHVDTRMDYDENSVMSESNTNTECDSQLGISHGLDSSSDKSMLLDSIHNTVSFLAPNDDEWEFLHSKQYIDNIYCQHGGCEPVKNEEGIRESDSPKTFIDLDTTTKEKNAQEKMRKDAPFMKGAMGGKHTGKSPHHQGYPSGARTSHNMYGNQYDNYGGMGSHRWSNYSRNGGDGSMSHSSKIANDRDGNQYDQNQYRQGYQSNYYPMNQGQNGDKMYNQSSYHGNEYNQNDSMSNYYNQGQSSKGYQGNYVNDGRYDPNYYQNKPNEYSSQGNMYPPTSTEIPGSRYGNQNYGGNQGGFNQHYTQQSPSHSGSNNMGQYPNAPNPNFSLPKKPEFGEAPPAPVKKKRGRKRKADKEPHDDSKPKPNTIVQASTNLGSLIDVDNPECPIETYDYNNQIETIFNFTPDDDLTQFGARFLEMEQRLCKKMMPIKYGHPVHIIYCPLTYAFQTHRDFVSKYLTSERPILFLGLNPGPYGMSQNGCPFGEANVVRDWLKIQGDIYKPEIEHPKKPITGLACTRNEVSGARFWGLFQKICQVPENFFKHCFVDNFCPFAYMSESGKNITPPQLEHSELDQINEACDVKLVELVKMLNVRAIIAVGKFVQQRASKALHNAGIMGVKVECILHPSPINPHANKGWEQIVAKQLIEMNVMQYLNPDADDVQRQIDEWEKQAQTTANAKIVVEPE